MKSGDPALELVTELKALVVSGGQMTTMDEKRVRAVTDAIRDAHRNVENFVANPYADMAEPFYSSAVQYQRANALRLKRCLLTYLNWRLDKITDTWWEGREQTLAPSLSPGEAVFLKEYGNVMVGYMMSFAVPLDLRSFTWRPPSSHQVTVVGLKECSFVSPLTGIIHTMYEGKRIRLNLEEAEQLLVQGMAQLVEE